MTSALALSAITLQAGEHTAKAGKFEQIIKLEAAAIPDAGYPVSIKPVVWTSVKIEKLLPHGSPVKKGEKLLWIDTDALDKKIKEFTKERVKQKLVLESSELELAALKNTTADSLAKAGMEYKRFQEDSDYYKKVTKPQNVSDREYKVKRANDYLSYTQEELDQLLKMYEEDGLTEETEEIIIKRAKHGLTGSKRTLAKAERDASYEGKVTTPRNDADWAISAEAKKRSWELTQKSLPLALKIKELDVAKLRRDDAIAAEQLKDLNADRELVEFKSPVNGVVYFGEFKDGKWINEAAKKIMRKGGVVPSNVTLMTIVPADTKLKFNAFLTEKQRQLFTPEQTGNLRLHSNPWKSISMKSELISEHPDFAHQWLVSFTSQADLPAGVMIGSKANISIVAASADDVLSIPVNAVKSNPDGTYTIRIKMAEGDPEVTTVELGRQAGDKIEVLSGLKNGQVILTP
ncbi:MAG: HlyD family secretion protein [Cryomorphaceae bacterium]|jgi:HlyD family secretion protein